MLRRLRAEGPRTRIVSSLWVIQALRGKLYAQGGRQRQSKLPHWKAPMTRSPCAAMWAFAAHIWDRTRNSCY